MNLNNKRKYSKCELLEIMLAQKTEIESLKTEIAYLKKENETKDRRIEETINIVDVTNKLIQIANVMEDKMNSKPRRNRLNERN